jgi:uncharacterized Zn finger protein
MRCDVCNADVPVPGKVLRSTPHWVVEHYQCRKCGSKWHQEIRTVDNADESQRS